jgi:hypothetical protein
MMEQETAKKSPRRDQEMNQDGTNIEELSNDEEILKKFDDFFEAAGSGWSLLVLRDAPKELRGFLEEIPIEDPGDMREQIDLGYLARYWGGEVLKLILRSPEGVFKKRIIIEMRSYPPLRRGRPIYEATHETKPEINPLEILKLARELSPAAPTSNPEMMVILKSLLDRQLNPPEVVRGSEDQRLLTMLTALSKMREFVQPPPEGTQWEAVAAEAVRSILPLLTEKMTAAPRPRPAVVQSAPAVPIVSGTASESVPDKPEEPKPPIELGDRDVLDAAQEHLQNMSGTQITQLYLAALQDLPENKRKEALDVLEESLFEDVPETEAPNNATPLRG